jgi:hypothetical protein
MWPSYQHRKLIAAQPPAGADPGPNTLALPLLRSHPSVAQIKMGGHGSLKKNWRGRIFRKPGRPDATFLLADPSSSRSRLDRA